MFDISIFSAFSANITNAVTGTHNYTANKAEHDNLVALGWKDEGIGWYGIEDMDDPENPVIIIDDPTEPVDSTEPPKTSLEIGDTVILGTYEQDNDISNGKEEIEWVILAKEGDKALVISKYALDSQPYNTVVDEVTWETCSLRKWMNETFIKNAFNSDEQEKILTTTVTADKNPYYDTTSPGNDTTDKVFLLSVPEVENYFSSDKERMCEVTEYAESQLHTTSNFKGFWTWWLRSPSYDNTKAALVDNSGSCVSAGIIVNYYHYGIRPAMWIKLGS